MVRKGESIMGGFRCLLMVNGLIAWAFTLSPVPIVLSIVLCLAITFIVIPLGNRNK